MSKKELRDALHSYDYLTAGSITHDAHVRPTVAEGLARAMSVDWITASKLLADALARRAATRENRV